MNLLEIGKILRPHGVKGAVKVESYIDETFSFKNVVIGKDKQPATIKSTQHLNKDFYIVTFNTIPNIDTAEKFRNQSIYIDRSEYSEFEDKVYLSDLINAPVVDENNEKIGDMVDYEDYGATVILTIRVGAVSYQIPYVEEIISYSKEKSAFVIEKQKFEDLKIWE